MKSTAGALVDTTTFIDGMAAVYPCTSSLGNLPTAAGTVSYSVMVEDSYGKQVTTATKTFTVTAGTPSGEDIQSAAIKADGSWTLKKGTAVTPRQFHCNPTPADDGTYVYRWYWQSTDPGLEPDDATSANPMFSGTPTASGSFTGCCDVTDTQGKTVTATWTANVSA